MIKGSYTGQTVSQMLALANKVLGGTSTASASSVNEVLNNINMNFDDGNGTNLGFLGYCAPSGGRDEAPLASNNEGSPFITLNTYPNPFVDRANFEFSVERTTYANFQVYSLTGERVQTLFDGTAEEKVQYKVEFAPAIPGMYIYRLSTSEGVKTGKVIQVK